jgi:multidrug transporter EmrE-like cation transporter
MKVVSFLLILISVALNASAQLLLKRATQAMGLAATDVASSWAVIVRAAVSPWVWAGLAAYVVSVTLWILVLSRVDVSYAYPMVSLGYVMAALAAWLFLHEDVSLTRIIGIGVVCIGVVLITRS